MKIILIHTESNAISGVKYTVEKEDFIILHVWNKLRFLMQGPADGAKDWTEWKCIEEVLQCDNLPEDDTILLSIDGLQGRVGNKKLLNLFLPVFKDASVHAFLSKALEIASFKEDRMDTSIWLQLFSKIGINPSPKPDNYLPRPKSVKPRDSKVSEKKDMLPPVIPVTPQIKSRMQELKNFVLNILSISLNGELVEVNVFFNRESESLCKRYGIPCPKDFLVLVEGRNISRHQTEISIFLKKETKIINDNLLYWEEKNI